MSRVVNLLNSDNTLQEVASGTRSAVIATIGCLRDRASFRNYDSGGGFDQWSQNYVGEGQTVANGNDLQELLVMRETFERNLPEGATKKKALAEVQAKIEAIQRPGGPRINYSEVFGLTNTPDFARQIRDTSLYMDRSRSLELADLGQGSTLDAAYSEQLNEAQRRMMALRILELRYQERIPLTAVLIGFTRGSYSPRSARLNMFHSGDPSQGIDVYANQTETEGIWIQLDPSATLGWLNSRVDNPQPVAGAFSQDLLTLQGSYDVSQVGLFGEITDSWTASHFGLLHTMSHLFIKAAGRLTGLEQEGISEQVLPFTNSFLLYANHSGDFVLGGLQLMMEHHMATVLAELRDDATRCIYNPVCENKNSACHGCVHLGEVSCANFNRTLKRNLLVGAGGFWT
jgi:hypothetical protein